MIPTSQPIGCKGARMEDKAANPQPASFEIEGPSCGTDSTSAAGNARSLGRVLQAGNRSPKRVLSPYSKRAYQTDADMAWAAGLFDGEGCVHIAKQTYGEKTNRQPTYRLRVSVHQTRLAVLHEFEWAVGLCGTYPRQQVTNKQTRVCHALVYDGVTAFTLLDRMSEFLRRKAPQAELAREFRRECAVHVHPGPKGHKESIWETRRWYYARMRILNKEG